MAGRGEGMQLTAKLKFEAGAVGRAKGSIDGFSFFPSLVPRQRPLEQASKESFLGQQHIVIAFHSANTPP